MFVPNSLKENMRNYHSASVIRVLSKYGMNKEASSVFIKNATEEVEISKQEMRWNWEEIHSLMYDVLPENLRAYFVAKTKDKPEALRIQLEKVINKLNKELEEGLIDEELYNKKMSSDAVDAVANFNKAMSSQPTVEEPAAEEPQELAEPEVSPEGAEADSWMLEVSNIIYQLYGFDSENTVELCRNLSEDIVEEIKALLPQISKEFNTKQDFALAEQVLDFLYDNQPRTKTKTTLNYPPRNYETDENLNEAITDYDDNILDIRQEQQERRRQRQYNETVTRAQFEVLDNDDITIYEIDDQGRQHFAVKKGWVAAYREIANQFYESILPDIARTAVMYFFRTAKFKRTRVDFQVPNQDTYLSWVKSMIIEPDYETMNLWGRGDVSPEVQEKKFSNMLEKLPLARNDKNIERRAREILLDYDNANDGISIRDIVIEEHALPAPSKFSERMQEVLEEESKRVLNRFLPTDLKHLPKSDLAVRESPLYRPNMFKVLGAIETELRKYIDEHEGQIRGQLVKEWKARQKFSEEKAKKEKTVVPDKRFVTDEVLSKDSALIKDIKVDMALKQGPKLEEIAKQVYQETKAKGAQINSHFWTWQEDVPIKDKEKAAKATKRFVTITKLNPTGGTVEMTIREQSGPTAFINGSLVIATIVENENGEVTVSKLDSVDDVKQIADITYESNGIFRLNTAINKVVSALRSETKNKEELNYKTILRDHRELVLEELIEADKMGADPVQLKQKYNQLIDDVMPKQEEQNTEKTASAVKHALNKLAYKQALQLLRNSAK